MRKPVIFMLLACLTAGLHSCYYDNQEELYPSTGNEPCGDPATSKYSTAVSKTMETYCFGCHKGANPSGNIHLDTYDGVKAVTAGNRLTDALRGKNGRQQMPPSGPIPECQIKTIEAWVAKGAPND